jgi:hypothetical protein
MRRNRKNVNVIVLILLLVGLVAGTLAVRMGVVPGPEGFTVQWYGVQFPGLSNKFHEAGQLSANQLLEKAEDSFSSWWGSASVKLEVRAAYPSPTNPVLKATYESSATTWLITAYTRYETSLITEIQRPLIQQVNQRGDPLGYSDPTGVRYIEYYKKVSETSTSIEWKKYVVHIVPVDYVIQFSVRGDKEFGWSDTHLWFVMDTNVWYQTFTKSQLLDRNPPEDAKLTAYKYRGGFPIWAWIGAWDPMVWQVVDTGKESGETENPPQEARDYVQIYPSLSGREITLYTDDPATSPYEYDLILSKDIMQNPDLLDDKVVNMIPALPDPRFATTVYFSIFLDKFMPYAEPTGPWWNQWESWKAWFPSAFMRVRVMYAVYGEFVYLWTKQEAEKWEYVWQNRTTTYEYHEGPWTQFWTGITSWLSNPWTMFWLFLFSILIILVILAVFAPGVLMLGGALAGRAARKIRKKGR